MVKGESEDLPVGELKSPRVEAYKELGGRNVREKKIPEKYEQYPMPIAMSPKNVMIVVAGGEQSGHAYFMQVGLSGDVVSKEIKLPAKWNQLLTQAEDELGPPPIR